MYLFARILHRRIGRMPTAGNAGPSRMSGIVESAGMLSVAMTVPARQIGRKNIIRNR